MRNWPGGKRESGAAARMRRNKNWRVTGGKVRGHALVVTPLEAEQIIQWECRTVTGLGVFNLISKD